MTGVVDTTQLSDEEWALTSFDPWDNQRLRFSNVWDIYQVMREHGPAIHSDAYGYLYSLPRYTDVKKAVLDHQTFSSARGNKIGRTQPSNPPGTPIEYDPPENNKFRAPMIAPFVPRRVGQFEPLVRHHVGLILDHIETLDAINVVEDLGERLAMNVISDIVGFDEDARERNKEHSRAVVHGTNEGYATRNEGYNEFLREQVARAKVDPQPGMLGDLATALVTGTTQLTDQNVASIIHAMGLAGLHSTINAVSTMMIRVCDPDLREQWLPSAEANVIEQFVEEALRIDAPIHLEGRWTTTAVNVGGVEIPADSQVALIYASANHDEEQFPDPRRFDASRTMGHLTFGHGIHTCLGMALARLEMNVLLEQLVIRYRSIELAGTPIDTGMVYGHHMGFESVPIKVA
jgi:cytochrome P450